MPKTIQQWVMVILMIAFVVPAGAHAQIIKKLGKKVEQKVKQRADRKVDETIDKGLDKAEEEAKDGTKKNDKKDKDADNGGEKDATVSSSFKVNTRFDFIAGDKVIAVDDFTRVNVGDFPGQWYTNGSGEVVTIDGQDGKWLQLQGNYTYYPEFIQTLPENFTLEYDLIYNYDDTKSLIRNIFGVYLVAADAKTKNEPAFKYGFNRPGQAGAGIEFESYQPNRLNIFTWENKKVDQDTRTNSEAGYIKQMRESKVHISIWRQKQRVRMYLDDKKIVDVPRLLKTGVKYNMVKFAFEDWKNSGRAYIANVRFAESVPDMRSKLITEGKFVTSGIYFSSNSDQVRPESYGIIKQIAEILASSPGTKIKIVGHTDSDGSTETNLALSKKRAESVKTILVKSYGIDATRIETDGKGESVPVTDNNTEAGKANNRRVEFIKL